MARTVTIVGRSDFHPQARGVLIGEVVGETSGGDLVVSVLTRDLNAADRALCGILSCRCASRMPVITTPALGDAPPDHTLIAVDPRIAQYKSPQSPGGSVS